MSLFFFFKQKTAYELRISDWSSDVCSSDLDAGGEAVLTAPDLPSGSDRIWAALTAVDPDGRHDVIVNVQGDLPALDPALIRIAAQAATSSSAAATKIGRAHV